MNKEMKIYDENGKMIEGNWKLCKEITASYDRNNPYEHNEIIKETVQQLAKEYNVDYDDVVKTVELLSGIEMALDGEREVCLHVADPGLQGSGG